MLKHSSRILRVILLNVRGELKGERSMLTIMFKKMRIKKRLTSSYVLISAITSIAGIVGCIAMIIIANQYAYALKYYGFSQGDIGKALITFADCRSATRSIIGYTDKDVVAEALATHDKNKESFNTYIKELEEILTTDEETILYERIKKELTNYWVTEYDILKLGNSSDESRSIEAQKRAVGELDPIYEQVRTDMSEFMCSCCTANTKISRAECPVCGCY